MQTTSVRYFFLSAVLLTAAAVYATLGEPAGAGTPRWPASDALYTVDTWSMNALAAEESSNRTSQITRVFRNANGATATFTMFTNQAPKLYGAGAEVPFLGGGFSVAAASADIDATRTDGVSGLAASRGAEQWLVMYAYGERRGLLGNGPLPWTLALLDGLAGRPNDYYKLYLTARTDQLAPSDTREIAELAHQLFPRIAAWYA